MSERLKALADAGVSIWLDDLSRERIETGNLADLVKNSSVVGVTTNPTIFAGALADGERYDAQVTELAAAAGDVDQALIDRAIFEITTTDVRQACDVLMDTFEATGGADGRVSIEVSPELASDTDATVASAKELWKAVDRPNLFIKIPATTEGAPAITTVLAEGISVNVTLIFGLERYQAVMDAYLEGLERARDNGKDLSKIQSVASFFVSRVDSEVDKRLDASGGHDDLKGKAAVANARLAYQLYEKTFAGERFKALAADGANAQRPLWASTGVKNPDYSDTMYVDQLIVANTVNTMPEKTMQAFADHGEVHGDAVTTQYDSATQVMADLEAAGNRLRRRHRRPGEGGCREVREVLERAAGHRSRPARERRPVSETLEVAATGGAAEAIAAHVPPLVEEGFAGRLFDQDPTLWGPEAESESKVRLAWVGLHRSSRPLVGEIAALRSELNDAGLDHIVLCGMGGSSLAPEVICATYGVELTVLDSSNPDQVRAAVADRLDRTVVVVSSKSGSTVETDSQRRAYIQAFTDAGIDPVSRIVIVTDPGSPLDERSRADGYRVVNADPHVGGRYSALTAFGLVPSGLAGADIAALLDEAEVVHDLLAEDDAANPGLRLGAAIAGTDPLRNKLVLVDEGSGLTGFADWAEQLIAESTGKQGTGILPVVVADDSAPEVALPPHDVTVARITPDQDDSPADAAAVDGSTGSDVSVTGKLGAQLLLWEVATAVAGRLLGINPFDQPDVESAKNAARGMLEGSADTTPADLTDGPVELRALGGDWLGGADDLRSAVAALLDQLDPERGYVAVMAYLDRLALADLADVRRTLAVRTKRPVTFGWGPRFLHSTGQFHKGGPAEGVYLQITGEPAEDLPVPGQEFSFGTLVAAQSAGDAQVLADHDRPVLRLHLTDLDAGLAAVKQALA